jgi:hypothetical protein
MESLCLIELLSTKKEIGIYLFRKTYERELISLTLKKSKQSYIV